MSKAAIQNLRENQQQVDMEGVMVGVSRQALDESLAYIAELELDAHTKDAFYSERIAELEAENAKLRGLCAAADRQGIRWRNGQDPEHREWDKTWEALSGKEDKSDE